MSPAPAGKAPRPVTPEDIHWTVLAEAHRELRALRRSVTEEAYRSQVDALKEFLCAYFNSGVDCLQKMTGIMPLGGMPGSGKAFKVRWALAGGGKSSGLRMAVSAICETRRVRIVGAWLRRDDPTDDELVDAFHR